MPYRGNIKEDEGKLLARVVRMVEKAGDGDRHKTLLRVARLAGGFVGAGRLDEQNAVLALETVASEWPQFTKSQKTIRDGIKYGLASPLFPETLPERPVERPVSQKAPTKSAEPVLYKFPDQTYQQPQPIYKTPERPAPQLAHETAERIEEVVTTSPEPEQPPQPRLIVKTIAEQLANPGSILRPDESQLYRMGEAEKLDELPPELIEPNLPVAAPPVRISKLASGCYFRWQKSHESPFSQLGLASLNKKHS